MTGSCILKEGGLSCWHMLGHTCAHNSPFHSIDSTTSPHLSSESCHAWLRKKELPSSLIKFLFTELTLTHTHMMCVCTPSVIWQRRWCLQGLQPQMCYFICVWVCAFILCSFVSFHSPEIWLVCCYLFISSCLFAVCVCQLLYSPAAYSDHSRPGYAETGDGEGIQ